MKRIESSARVVILAFAVGFCYLATIFVIVGLTTNNWIEIRDRSINSDDVEVSFGLNRICFSDSDRCNNPGTSYDRQNGLPSVRGLVIAGAFVSVIACILVLVNLLFDRLGVSDLRLVVVTIVFVSLAGLLIMIGAIVFSSNVEVRTEYITYTRNQYKGYSFGLTACAGGMFIIGAILVTVSAFTKPSPVFV